MEILKQSELEETPASFDDFKNKLFLCIKEELEIPNEWFDWYLSQLQEHEKINAEETGVICFKGVKLKKMTLEE